jgi:hypothetical protein
MQRSMSLFVLVWTVLLPAVAFANPNSDSPEPATMALVALGAAPVVIAAWRKHRADKTQG